MSLVLPPVQFLSTGTSVIYDFTTPTISSHCCCTSHHQSCLTGPEPGIDHPDWFSRKEYGHLYVDSMGYNGTSTLYANSSRPRICTIRPTAAWSTPAVSLTLDSLRSMRSFSRRTLPVDDVCSGTRTLHWWINKVRNLVDVLVFIHQNEEFWILGKDQKIRNGDINITYRWYLSRVVLGIMTTTRIVWVHGDRASLLVR